LVLVSVDKNQIRIGSDFWELVAELEPEIFNFLRTGSGTRFRNQISYSIYVWNQNQDFWEKNN
jgi:hypothetical protein